MSTPGKSQSGASPASTPGEASSFRRQSEVSATVKPLQLRGGQSPVSGASASHTPRQQQQQQALFTVTTPESQSTRAGAARRLSTEVEDSPPPVLGGRLPARRLSTHKSNSSPRSDDRAGSPFASPLSAAATPMLYNPSIRSSSHPHPIRLRVPKSEEREELSPESESGGAADVSPSSQGSGWSGKLRVPVTRASPPLSAATTPTKAKNVGEAGVTPPFVGPSPSLPAPGASLIQEALAARGITPVRPPVAPAAAAGATPMTEQSESVEISRLTAHSLSPNPEEGEGNADRQVVEDDGDRVAGVHEGEPVAASHDASSSESFDVSETSAAVTPSPGPKPQQQQLPHHSTDQTTSPPSLSPSPEADTRASASAQAPPPQRLASPNSGLVPPGKPPLHDASDALKVAAATASVSGSGERQSRSRSGSAGLLVSPSRSPEKEPLAEAPPAAAAAAEPVLAHDVLQPDTDITTPVDAVVETPVSSTCRSPQRESDRVSYVSEDLKRPTTTTTTPPSVEGLTEVPAAPAVADQAGQSDEDHTATPPRTVDHHHRARKPRAVPSSSSSSSSSGSSFSPRLSTVSAVRPALTPADAVAHPLLSGHSASDNDADREGEARPNDATAHVVEQDALPRHTQQPVDNVTLHSFNSSDSSLRQQPQQQPADAETSQLPGVTTAELHTPLESADVSGAPLTFIDEPTLTQPPPSQPSLLESTDVNASLFPALDVTTPHVERHSDDDAENEGGETSKNETADDVVAEQEDGEHDQVQSDEHKSAPNPSSSTSSSSTTPRAPSQQQQQPDPGNAVVTDEVLATSTGDLNAEDSSSTTSSSSSSKVKPVAASSSPPRVAIEASSSVESSPDASEAALVPPSPPVVPHPHAPGVALFDDDDDIESMPDYEAQVHQEQGQPQEPTVRSTSDSSLPDRKDDDEDEDGESFLAPPPAPRHADMDEEQEEQEEGEHEKDESEHQHENAVSGSDASSSAHAEDSRAVISSIPHSDGDDAPTYTSSSNQNQTRPAARTLFATCISDPAKSDSDDEEEASEAPVRDAGLAPPPPPVLTSPSVQTSHDSDQDAAPPQSTQDVVPAEVEGESPHDARASSEPEEARVAASDASHEAPVAPAVAEAVPGTPKAAVPSPKSHVKTRFAISSSSSSSSSSSAAASRAPSPNDSQHEAAPVTAEADADANPHLEEAQQEVTRAASSSSASSSSSSGSLFRPHQVEREVRHDNDDAADAAPLVVLTQTTALLELPDVKDEEDEDESQEGDESHDAHAHAHGDPQKADGAGAETHTIAAPPVDVSSEASEAVRHDTKEAPAVAVKTVTVQTAKSGNEPRDDTDTNTGDSEDEEEDDAVIAKAPAHPFSPAGRRAQHDLSALSARSGYSGATPSRLPPDSVLFHTAHSPSSASSNDDEDNAEPLRPHPVPEVLSTEARRRRVLQGYLDDMASLEAGQRALLTDDFLQGWRALLEEEAIARGALPQQVATSKLHLSSHSGSGTSRSASVTSKSSSRSKTAAAAPPSQALQAPRESSASVPAVRRFTHVSSSSPTSSSSVDTTSSSSSSSSVLQELCEAMDGIHRSASELANCISAILADEQVYRRFVEEKELEARSGLSRLARSEIFAIERAARAFQESPSRSNSAVTSSSAHNDNDDDDEKEKEKEKASARGKLGTFVDLGRPQPMQPAVLIAMEPLERDDICTAEMDAWIRLRQLFRLGLAALCLDTEFDIVASEESLNREVVSARESRDRALLGEYHHSRLSGSSPSSAVGAAARLLASLSLDGDDEDPPEFFEWDPTTNTSGHKTSADDSQHQHQQQQQRSGSAGGGRGRPGSKGHRSRTVDGQTGVSATTTMSTTTSSPSPRVHSSLLLTSSDPSQEGPLTHDAKSAKDKSQKSKSSGNSTSHSASNSARRSPTVVPNAQTEAASLLRSMHNARKAVANKSGAHGVRRSRPHAVHADLTDTASKGSAELTQPPAQHASSRLASSSTSSSRAHSTHAQREQSWRRSLRGASDASGSDAAPVVATQSDSAQASRHSRRVLPRTLTPPPPLLSRHTVPCSYRCRSGAARTQACVDCNVRYHELLQRYGMETKDGSPVRSVSSSSRTPRSPSTRPYSDVAIFDSPSRTSEQCQAQGEEEDEDGVLYYTHEVYPASPWSVEAHDGSPRAQALGRVVSQGGIDAPSLSELDDAHHNHNHNDGAEDNGSGESDRADRFNHVFRVLYPPEKSAMAESTEANDNVAGGISNSDEEDALPGSGAVASHALAPTYIEVIRRGPVLEPSAAPPAAAAGAVRNRSRQKRSVTRRPASMEACAAAEDADDDNRARTAEVDAAPYRAGNGVLLPHPYGDGSDRYHQPHYVTPTTLSVTRAQDEQLLQAIARARGCARASSASQHAAKDASTTSAATRVRCSRKWSPVKTGGATAAAPVLITRLPLEAGPGVWPLDMIPRGPHAATTTTTVSGTRESVVVCVATVDPPARVASGHRKSASPHRRHAQRRDGPLPDARLHGSVMADPAAVVEAPPQDDSALDGMARAFRRWAENGGVGVVHLPTSMARELPVPMRASLPAPSPSPKAKLAPPPPPAESRAANASRTHTPSKAALKYSYVDRFYKQSPEQVARTLEVVAQPQSPMRDWSELSPPQCDGEYEAESGMSGESGESGVRRELDANPRTRALWPPEASRVYEKSAEDVSEEAGYGDDSAAYASSYWKQRRALRESQAARAPRFTPSRQRQTSPSAATLLWARERDAKVQQPSSHAYVGRHGATHAYA